MQPIDLIAVGTNDPDTFKLLWSSAVSTTPTLFWGTSSGSYQNTVTATTSRVSKSQMCGAPANSTGWRDLGLIHQALLTGEIIFSAIVLAALYSASTLHEVEVKFEYSKKRHL